MSVLKAFLIAPPFVAVGLWISYLVVPPVVAAVVPAVVDAVVPAVVEVVLKVV